MRLIGLTGGIATGKSEVARMLEARGATYFAREQGEVVTDEEPWIHETTAPQDLGGYAEAAGTAHANDLALAAVLNEDDQWNDI